MAPRRGPKTTLTLTGDPWHTRPFERCDTRHPTQETSHATQRHRTRPEDAEVPQARHEEREGLHSQGEAPRAPAVMRYADLSDEALRQYAQERGFDLATFLSQLPLRDAIIAESEAQAKRLHTGHWDDANRLLDMLNEDMGNLNDAARAAQVTPLGVAGPSI